MSQYPRRVPNPDGWYQADDRSSSSSSSSVLWTMQDDECPIYAKHPGNAHARDSAITLVNAVHPAKSEMFTMSFDLSLLTSDKPEPDDELHKPDPPQEHGNDMGGHILTQRGLMNLGCILVLVVGLLALFTGYPAIMFFTKRPMSFEGAFGVGGTNMTGQVPDISGNYGLIDRDTPAAARIKTDYVTGKQWQLVFSDEFNVEGRSFYSGDDPYWEAVDLHYWPTNNKEWYDPSAITTRNGSLEIMLSQQENHGLNYTGGMMSTWNKFCFTGGLIEASVSLPGFHNVAGLWPAIWAMGNLGRAGYGATTEGMWPYSYDSCDVGTVANQSVNGLPIAATINGDKYNQDLLSFQPGQKLSRCTCPGESHPGPLHDNGEFVGRSAPEIDMFEAQIGGGGGEVSQSVQWAPFNHAYKWNSTRDTYTIVDRTISHLNTYKGGVYQQPTSAVTRTDQRAYELSGGEYSVYGFQYKPGFGDAYVAWIADGVLSWQLNAAGVGADPVVEISARPIPQEPMYLIMNLGISEGFGYVDYNHLQFPSTMRVDWVRVYQDPTKVNIGCDPPDFPTKAYIDEHIVAYSNPNLTTWVGEYHQTWPKNKFLGECQAGPHRPVQ